MKENDQIMMSWNKKVSLKEIAQFYEDKLRELDGKYQKLNEDHVRMVSELQNMNILLKEKESTMEKMGLFSGDFKNYTEKDLPMLAKKYIEPLLEDIRKSMPTELHKFLAHTIIEGFPAYFEHVKYMSDTIEEMVKEFSIFVLNFKMILFLLPPYVIDTDTLDQLQKRFFTSFSGMSIEELNSYKNNPKQFFSKIDVDHTLRKKHMSGVTYALLYSIFSETKSESEEVK